MGGALKGLTPGWLEALCTHLQCGCSSQVDVQWEQPPEVTAKEIEYRFTLVANNDDPHKADDHHRYVLPGNMTSYVV